MRSTITAVEKNEVEGKESMEGNNTSVGHDNSSIQELKEEIDKLKRQVQNSPPTLLICEVNLKVQFRPIKWRPKPSNSHSDHIWSYILMNSDSSVEKKPICIEGSDMMPFHTNVFVPNRLEPVRDNFTYEQLDTVTWEEFINNTTIHGVRYMFTKGIIIRRILWFIVVAIGITLFVYQVADRIAVFYERNTNVDVAVKYIPMVEFPSVTICNQNNYRITSAVDWNLYNFINDYFSANNVSENYNLTGINTTEFVLTTAHQKEDLIHRCTWNGKSCNISHDFNTALTDLGVCYTFNDGDLALKVTESGSSNGLSLLLNIEQYEIMRGPQIDAGAKVLLHDQGESPQMKDRGFAVAPGTHTFVGVTNLPDPYGDCQDKNPVAVSKCQLRCKTKTVVEKCECHDVYMKSYKNNTYDFNKLQATCKCAVPCKRVLFEPKLSYAQLSHLNIEKYVVGDDERTENIKVKFHNASETAQRYVEQIVARDKTEITGLLDASLLVHQGEEYVFHQTYAFTPQDIYAFMGRLSYAWHIFQDNMFIKDDKTIERFIKKKIDLLTSYETIETNGHIAHEALLELSDLMGFYNHGTASKAVDFLRFCSDQYLTEEITSVKPSQSQLSSSDLESSDSLFPSSITATTDVITMSSAAESSETTTHWQNIRNNDECTAAMEDFKQHLQNVTSYVRFSYGRNLSNLEEAFSQDSYENRNNIKSTYPECFTAIEESSHIIASFLTTMWNSVHILQAVHYSLMAEAIEKAEQVLSEYDVFLIPQSIYEQMDNRIREACIWTRQYAEDLAENATTFKADIRKVRDSLRRAEPLLRRWAEHLFAIGRLQAFPIEGMMNDYIAKRITKVQLAEKFASPAFLTLREDFIANVTEMKNLIKQYIDELYLLRDLLWHGYVLQLSLSPPIIDWPKACELELVKAARSVESTKYDYNSWASHCSLGEIIFHIPEVIKNGPLDDVKYRVEEPLDEMVEKLKMVDTNLLEYQESIKMDSGFFLNNFVQVDIFYQELSYEEIEQDIAFEFLSLLSEIGGFLGLLLGASVLTVCELVDFVTLATINKLKKKQNAVGTYAS